MFLNIKNLEMQNTLYLLISNFFDLFGFDFDFLYNIKSFLNLHFFALDYPGKPIPPIYEIGIKDIPNILWGLADLHALVFFDLFGLLSLITIFLLLFYNMLFYSFKYYIIKFLFSFWSGNGFNQINHVINTYISKIFKFKPVYIVNNIADTTFSCLVISLSLAVYHYYNNIFFRLSHQSIEYHTSGGKFFFLQNHDLLSWIPFDFDSINIGLIIDPLSILMLIIVLSISTLVHYYSIDYMYSDPRLITFMKYLSGFTAAMVILITANNLSLVFLGWEGVGIFSYLLIGFWYTRTLALKASLKAVIVNKIGDIALLLGMSLCLYYFGTTEFNKLQILSSYLTNEKFQFIELSFFSFWVSVISLISFFLLIAAIGKSAQFGLHTWLPDAMEGPTPVSALIHAATMVTAGVYLIVWTSFFFENSDFCWNFTIIVGGLTALFGSAVACVQYDIKKIIAFSTCSQIGYMFLACGLSCYNIAMFHLFTHAFFKALLFLCAGSIIHSVQDQQDIRKMGGLFKSFPITFSGIIVGLISLMGFPFTSGFYSKDSIIEMALAHNSLIGFYGFTCSILAAFLTAFYCYRFVFYIFFSKTKQPRINLQNIEESGFFMLSAILTLIVCTIFVGICFKQTLSTPFSFFHYYNAVSLDISSNCLPQSEYFIFSSLLKIFIFLIPLCGLLTSIVFYNINTFKYFLITIEKESLSKVLPNTNFFFFFQLFHLWHCLQTKGSIDYIYNKFITLPLLNFSYSICYINLDRGWLEYFFVKIPTKIVFFNSNILNKSFQNITDVFGPSMVFLLSFFTTILFLF